MPARHPPKERKKRSTKGSTDVDEPSTSLGTLFRESGGLAAIVAAAAVGISRLRALRPPRLGTLRRHRRPSNAVVHWWCRALRPFTPNQRRAFWLFQFIASS